MMAHRLDYKQVPIWIHLEFMPVLVLSLISEIQPGLRPVEALLSNMASTCGAASVADARACNAWLDHCC